MNEYIKSNQQRFIDELIELLKIPSVSADPDFKNDIQNAASYVARRLEEAGCENAEVCPTEGNPIVYGEYIVDDRLPTILIYGHYDVQPPDPLELWESDPFDPVIKDEKIVARGASDDKGQMYMHIKVLETLKQNGVPTCNMKFMIEGEEEVGSESLEGFINENKDRLSADFVLISDTGIISNEHPSITVGLRGLSYMEVEVTGPNKDLHSGMFGGAVANPINVLCKIIARLRDDQNRVTIPGFYDDVADITIEETKAMAKAPFDEEAYKEMLGIDEVYGEAGYSTRERVSIRPSLDVNGIWGGYIGKGAKTVLPSKAYAKISMRLVPYQDPDKISDLFADYFTSLAPKGVKVKVTPHHGAEPAVTPIDFGGYRAAEEAFEKVWGKTPIPMREGGSIPIVATFEKKLGLKSLMLGFGLDEDAIHSPNESFRIHNYLKGIETLASFHQIFHDKYK